MTIFLHILLVCGSCVLPCPSLFNVNSSSNVGIEGTTPSSPLRVNGSIVPSCPESKHEVGFTLDRKVAEEKLSEGHLVFALRFSTRIPPTITELHRNPKPQEFVIEETPVEVK